MKYRSLWLYNNNKFIISVAHGRMYYRIMLSYYLCLFNRCSGAVAGLPGDPSKPFSRDIISVRHVAGFPIFQATFVSAEALSRVYAVPHRLGSVQCGMVNVAYHDVTVCSGRRRWFPIRYWLYLKCRQRFLHPIKKFIQSLVHVSLQSVETVVEVRQRWS